MAEVVDHTSTRGAPPDVPHRHTDAEYTNRKGQLDDEHREASAAWGRARVRLAKAEDDVGKLRAELDRLPEHAHANLARLRELAVGGFVANVAASDWLNRLKGATSMAYPLPADIAAAWLFAQDDELDKALHDAVDVAAAEPHLVTFTDRERDEIEAEIDKVKKTIPKLERDVLEAEQVTVEAAERVRVFRHGKWI